MLRRLSKRDQSDRTKHLTTDTWQRPVWWRFALLMGFAPDNLRLTQLMGQLSLAAWLTELLKSLINAFWVGLAMMTSQDSHFSVVKVQPAYMTSNVEAIYLQESSILLLDSLSSDWSQLVWEAFTWDLECLHCLPSYFVMCTKTKQKTQLFTVSLGPRCPRTFLMIKQCLSA